MSRHDDADCVFRFDPKTKSQREAFAAFLENDLVFLLGAAGSGKSHVALACAVHDALKTRTRRSVLIIRPNVETGPTLGRLPGELHEKLQPYREAADALLAKMAWRLPPDCLQVKAAGYLRGCTFDNCTVVLDEAQNFSFAQLKMLLTRMGSNCKVIVTGDPDQCDVRPASRNLTDLELVVSRLDGLARVAVITFSPGDCCRHPLVQRILRRL
jgi:phosphate starvation-inducible PhoH-like protein